jgi:hypothetical protein
MYAQTNPSEPTHTFSHEFRPLSLVEDSPVLPVAAVCPRIILHGFERRALGNRLDVVVLNLYPNKLGHPSYLGLRVGLHVFEGNAQALGGTLLGQIQVAFKVWKVWRVRSLVLHEQLCKPLERTVVLHVQKALGKVKVGDGHVLWISVNVDNLKRQ